MSTLLHSPMAKIELNLHYVADLDRAQVKAELRYLAKLAPSTSRDDPLSIVLGLSFDTAPVLEENGELSALFVTLVRVQQPDELLTVLLKSLPIIGAEIVYALSEGFYHIRFAQRFAPAPSFHTLVKDGKISNHDRLEIRGRALAALEAFEFE